MYYWGSVSPGDVGRVIRFDSGSDVLVEFPSQPVWRGLIDEMQRADATEQAPSSGHPWLIGSSVCSGSSVAGVIVAIDLSARTYAALLVVCRLYSFDVF